MTKRNIIALACGFVSMTAVAAPRTTEQALAIAKQFALNHPALCKAQVTRTQLSSKSSARLVHSVRTEFQSRPFDVFNVGEDNGFIVVSADDRFKPVLGYSTQGHIAEDGVVPDGLQYWLNFLSEEMAAAIEAGYPDVAYAAEASNAGDYSMSVAPLLTTQWDQTAPYNNKIPNYATGCVATGVAQVMNYWKYPTMGKGSHTNAYNSQYSADFGATTYDWANMKDTYGGKYDTKAEVEAVSTLMLHLGIATDMRWAKPETGSGTPNMYAGNALINFFSYNKNLYAEQRDCMSLGAWKSLIINQLQTGHPLCYAGMTGVSGMAGHFFVLDGYDAATGLFHFNWGWSGKFDGYYSITALEPGVGGVGAGTGSFNYDQQMFVNVQPTESGEYVAHFDAQKITPSASSTQDHATFLAQSLAHNSLNFKGDAGLAVYLQDGTFHKFIASKNGLPTGGFAPGSVYSGDYAFEMNLSSLPDGAYTVCLATQHENYPGIVYPIRAHYGSATYFAMSVAAGKVSFAENLSDYNISDVEEPVIVNALAANTLYQNVVSEFQIVLKNSGTTAFDDEVGVCIKKTRESNPQYITIPCTLLPGEQKTIVLSGKVLREPGNYKLLPCYGENGQYVTLSQGLDVAVTEAPVGIHSIGSAAGDAVIYNIQGMRVSDKANLPRGLYIKNGKKIIR